jgi:DNA-binding NarL/FixJ family response regulator
MEMYEATVKLKGRMSARILLVDDVEVVRSTLRSLLAEYTICGEAENGLVALDQVRQLKPDVVVLDITMPVMNGLKATVEIRRFAPSTKIILFTINDTPEAQEAARMVGADALVPKSRAGTDLLPTVQRFTLEN